jgi:hypothetical protein
LTKAAAATKTQTVGLAMQGTILILTQTEGFIYPSDNRKNIRKAVEPRNQEISDKACMIQ